MDQEYLQALTQESQEYLKWKSILAFYADLYVGGAEFKARASNYLYQRHREPNEIYQERTDRAFYENYIGSIIDWYSSTLFRRELIITIDEASQTAGQLYSAFFNNCDQSGTNISDFFRKQFREALIYGRSYVCLEFPSQTRHYTSRLDEVEAGADKPYLVGYTAVDVINTTHDAQGKLERICILLGCNSSDTSKFTSTKQYIVYDRSHFITIEELTSETGSRYTVTAEGPHSCTNQQMLPVFELKLSEGMWLMNKAASLQLEHFNKSNSLAWSLGMALYATPVIYSKKDWSKMIGESYYIHLDPDDKFGWTEPEGNVYKIALDNLNRLQEEIYRTCYLMNQSKSWLGSSSNASASSKKRDYQITQEILRAYGDNVKDCVKKLIGSALLARKDKVLLSVTGLDEFEAGEFKEELEEAKALLNLGVESTTFKKQLFRRLVFKLLSDINETEKYTIASEIDRALEK